MFSSANVGSNFYQQVVETSMDLKKIQAQLAASKYKCGKDFLDDGKKVLLRIRFHVLSNLKLIDFLVRLK